MMIHADMKNFLSRHDVVYLSPPRHGWEGLPIGNGSFGGPLWAAEDGLIFQANHTDAFELPQAEGSEMGAAWAVLRSCARLSIEHAVPLHDWLYLNDFEARLSMHGAEVRSLASGAFGRFETRAFVHAERPVAVFQHSAAYTGDLGQLGAPIRITLERWGSRVFGWWYHHVQGGAGFTLGETRAFVDGGDACLTVSFRGVSVALRCRVIGARAEAIVSHSHQVVITVQAAPCQAFTLLLACVTSHSADDPEAAAKQALEDAAADLRLADSHRLWWERFWTRSFVHIPQDHFENLYYLHHYLMGSSSRGKYPPLFNGALWLWNRDVRNWVHPHHWNEQQSYWCLPAAGRTDLMRPYLDTYHRLMPEAIAATRHRGFKGMLWVDQHDFFGRQVAEEAPSFRDNYTPAAQIAMLFWWYFRYTGDVAHLREKGYPFLAAVGDFYLGMLRWIEGENRYEVPLASTYEDERPVRFTDTITNLAMIRAVLPALIEASSLLDVDLDKRPRWQHVLDHLPPYRLNDRDKGRGVTPASGLLPNGEIPPKEDHNHGPLFCPVFPAGDVGLKDVGSPIFDAERNALATYPPRTLAITPTVCIAARLGMPEVAAQRLDAMVRNLQQFPNGMFFNIDHWHYLSRRLPAASPADCANDPACRQRDYLDDRGCRFKDVRVYPSARDGTAEHRADIPCDPFSQMGMESLGHFAAGLQEMLLQSHERVIRVFPAVPPEWECSFSLFAEGGFLVTSHKPTGRPAEWIEVVSHRGGRCTIALPWSGPTELVSDGTATATSGAHGMASFDTEPGTTYLVMPKGTRPPELVRLAGESNLAPKRFHEAMIGKERDF